jgi:hypothetical protein
MNVVDMVVAVVVVVVVALVALVVSVPSRSPRRVGSAFIQSLSLLYANQCWIAIKAGPVISNARGIGKQGMIIKSFSIGYCHFRFAFFSSSDEVVDRAPRAAAARALC